MAAHRLRTDLHLEIFGEREQAVLVHGSFSWGLDTFPHQRVLGEQHRVILVDRRGFGDSPPVADMGWPTDMHDIAALLVAIGGAHLVGQSYGALVCLLAAGLRPDFVRSLVAIEPPAFGVARDDAAAVAVTQRLQRVYRMAPVMTAAEFFDSFYQALGASPEYIQQRTASFSDKEWAAVDSSRRERDPTNAPIPFQALRQAAFPKLLVHGTLRPERQLRRARVAVCETIAKGIGAELIALSNSEHNPQMEEPAKFNELLRTTWSRVAVQSESHV